MPIFLCVAMMRCISFTLQLAWAVRANEVERERENEWKRKIVSQTCFEIWNERRPGVVYNTQCTSSEQRRGINWTSQVTQPFNAFFSSELQRWRHATHDESLTSCTILRVTTPITTNFNEKKKRKKKSYLHFSLFRHNHRTHSVPTSSLFVRLATTAITVCIE